MSKELTDQKFEELVVQSELPVLVDFWAPWCAPCRVLGPVIDELAEELSDSITIYKMNVDENSEVTSALNIRSIPYVAIFVNGEVVASSLGAVTKGKLLDLIDGVVGENTTQLVKNEME